MTLAEDLSKCLAHASGMRWEEVAYELSLRVLPDERTWLEVCEAVCRRYGAELVSVLERDRHKAVTRARHACWYELRHNVPIEYSYPEIARAWKMDHTSIMSGVAKHAGRLAKANLATVDVDGKGQAEERKSA